MLCGILALSRRLSEFERDLDFSWLDLRGSVRSAAGDLFGDVDCCGLGEGRRCERLRERRGCGAAGEAGRRAGEARERERRAGEARLLDGERGAVGAVGAVAPFRNAAFCLFM